MAYGNIEENLKHCHEEGVYLFDEILAKSSLNKDLIKSIYLNNHNIFYSNKIFFNQYCQFLNDYLVPKFDQKFNKKIGAWLSERLLHLFAHSFFKVEEKEIIVLNKI